MNLVYLELSENKLDCKFRFSKLKNPLSIFLEESGQPVAFDSIF